MGRRGRFASMCYKELSPYWTTYTLASLLTALSVLVQECHEVLSCTRYLCIYYQISKTSQAKYHETVSDEVSIPTLSRKLYQTKK